MEKINNLVTIVIPCKNEKLGLIDTINSLNFSGEIIISDSSDDDTIDILNKNLPHSNIMVIKGGLPAIARNNGAKLVKTKYVLFIDSDIIIKDKKFLTSIVDKMESGDYDLLTCRINTNDSLIYKLSYYFFDLTQVFSSFIKPFAVGGFMLFKLDKFNELGGFNELDKFAEDFHLSSKIESKKFKIMNKTVYTPSRRFKNKGLFYMGKLMFKCWLNRNNDDFFKKDYNYWD